MPTSLDLSSLLAFSSAYLVILFAIAWLAEHRRLPGSLVRHPLTYTLSLGVYASAWAFYGAVGLAHQYGYAFLSIYLGLSGAFLIAPMLLFPILRLTRTYQLSSLADLFAFRFRSTWAGTLTTLVMLVSVLPLLALQIQSIADSIGIITGQPIKLHIAAGFCALITLFTILFGARHVTTRERHEGLVLVIAFESLVKLVSIAAVGLYAVYGVFGGFEGMQQWLVDNQVMLSQLHTPLQEGPWRTLLLVFFSAAIVMPHLYHMAFTENLSPRALPSASWGLPLFLLLMGLAVPPILWSGLKLGLDSNPEYFSLTLGMATGQDWLVLATYLGGLSAASGVVIVITLALSGMVLNHMLLPLVQPPAQSNIYHWLKWTRRGLIAAIIAASFGFYLLLGTTRNLTHLGIVSFVATLQFLPGALAVLYWQIANRRGFIGGILAGSTVWFLTMLLPLIIDLRGFQLPLLDMVYVLDNAEWHISAIASLVVNAVVFVLLSVSSQPSDEERSVAEACVVGNVSRSQRRALQARSPQEFAVELSRPLGARNAQREVERALQDLDLPFDERRPYALRRLRDRIEANLSGLMGPSVARDIVSSFLPYQSGSEVYVREDIHFIESRLENYRSQLTGLAAELDALRRYHRQTLQELPMGVCSLTEDQEILMWNRVMEDLTRIPASRVLGSHISSLPDPWCELLDRFISTGDAHSHKQAVTIDGLPRWFSLHKAQLGNGEDTGGGMVLLVEDQTELQLLEDRLVHSERLASIGRLAAGVAHEIGNPVTGIACLAQILQEEREEDAEIHDSCTQIIEQTKRISRILQSLMSFAHAGSPQQDSLEAVSLAAAASDAIALLSLNREHPVRFYNLCDPQHVALGDPQRIAQVLINLLSNARDASPADGSILVRSEKGPQGVTLIVEDEGSGIPAELLDRLYEPFFTTKDPGKGTGLGLALVYSIVEEHHGRISIDSPADPQRRCGTRVSIQLPSPSAVPAPT